MTESVFQDLPRGWRKVPLECLILRMSNGLTKRQTKDGRGFAVSRIETISQGVVDFSRVGYLPDLSPSEIENYRLRDGDILFSHINSDYHLGKTAVVSPNGSTLLHGMNLLLIRVDQEKVLPRFLHWFFNYYRLGGFFMSIAQHAVNQSSINQAKLKGVPILLPPVDEQREIVAEIEKQFTRLEAGVAGLRRVQAKLKRYRAAVLKAACEGKLVPTEAALARQEGRTYETGAQLLERILTERRQKWNGKGKYKEPTMPDPAALPEPPDGWTWIELGQLAWSVKDGPHYSPEYVKDGVPFITGGNVRPTGVDFENAKRISRELHAELSKRCKPEYGDILYTKGGTTGIARVNTYDEEFNVWVHVAVLKLVHSVEPFFVQHMLNSPLAYAQAQRFTHGVGNQDLGLTRMVHIRFPLPPLVEQSRIVAEVDLRLSVVEELEAVANANLQRTNRLRQSILQRTFEPTL